MLYGVYDKFPCYAQYGVGCVVGDDLSRHREADGEGYAFRVREKGAPYGLREVLFVERLVPQVPEAVSQLADGRLERAFDYAEVPRHFLRRVRYAAFRRLELHYGAVHGLRDGIVQFYREACALHRADVGFGPRDVACREFASAPLGESPQRTVPHEYGGERGEKRADDGEEPPRRPPRRTREDAYVVRRVDGDEYVLYVRIWRLGPPGLRLYDADPRGLDGASHVDVVKRVRG